MQAPASQICPLAQAPHWPPQPSLPHESPVHAGMQPQTSTSMQQLPFAPQSDVHAQPEGATLPQCPTQLWPGGGATH